MTLGDLVAGLEAGDRGVAVRRKRRRTVWRVADGARAYYAKRGTGPDARDLVREGRRLRDLRAAGLPAVEVLAEGDHGGARWIVTAAAPGRALDAALASALASGARRTCRALLLVAARLAGAVHGAGFRWPDMTADHVLVDAPGDGSGDACVVAILDVVRAERPRGGVTSAHRARDIAALLFSLPYGSAGRTDVVRIVRAACGDSAAASAVLRRLDPELRRLALRTRWRHGYAGAAPDVVAALTELRGVPPEPLFDALLSADRMDVLRTLPDRENRRFGAFFMKVYPPVRRGLSPAMRERRGIDRFRRAGVPVCSEAAYGEDVDRGSFLVVRGCAGEPLDDLLRRGVEPAERRILARELGRIFGRMRRAGLRHRDAYACHVFVARDSSRRSGFELRLIDLSRAGDAPRPRERWFVKDAAQLLHGVPRAAVASTDLLRFLRAYFDVGRLDARARRFARRVAAKERRIAARQERKRAGR